MPLTVRDGEANLFFQWNLSGDPEPMFSAIGIGFVDGLSHEEQATVIQNCLTAGTEALAVECPSDYELGPGHGDLGVTDEDNIRVDGTDTFPGLQVSDATQQNTAILVHKTTITAGRAGRGRMFWPGAVDGFVAPNGVLDPAYLDNLQDQAESFAGSLFAVTGVDSLLLFHTAEVSGSEIITLSVDPVVATQRRRLRR